MYVCMYVCMYVFFEKRLLLYIIIINYCPISLLPVFSKIFEKIIYSRMYEFLELNKLIYNRQFGFRANHSTNHALISMTESIKSFLDSGDFVAGIFCQPPNSM